MLKAATRPKAPGCVPPIHSAHRRWRPVILAMAAGLLLATVQNARALEPLAGIAETDRLVFSLGRSQWDDVWKPAPDADVARDGLGPLYSAASCAACHPGGDAAPGPRFADDLAGLATRLSLVVLPPDLRLGEQIQPFGHAIEGETMPPVLWAGMDRPFGGQIWRLTMPVFQPVPSGPYGGVSGGHALSGRVPPQVHGLGLLAAVPEAAIAALADPDDADEDGISGRVAEAAGGRLGRFGWRAERATIAEQVSHAFSRDMGLSTPAFPDPAGDCTKAQAACRAAPDGAGGASGATEVPASVVEQLSDAVFLSAPPTSDPPGGDGADIFREIGCAACHVPSLPVDDPRLPVETAAAFTDLLLHDLGEGLADRDGSGTIIAAEWRTAPLWGVGRRVKSAEPSLLHDGRAATLAEAILWHGGEAEAARHRFLGLGDVAKMTLENFLAGL